MEKKQSKSSKGAVCHAIAAANEMFEAGYVFDHEAAKKFEEEWKKNQKEFRETSINVDVKKLDA